MGGDSEAAGAGYGKAPARMLFTSGSTSEGSSLLDAPRSIHAILPWYPFSSQV